MGHGTETLDRGFVTKSSNPCRILTFLTIRRRAGAQNVRNVKESLRNSDIPDRGASPGRQVDPHDEKGGKPLAREQFKII